MFSDIAETHAKRVSLLRADRDLQKSQAIESCNKFSKVMLDYANRGAEGVYASQIEIEKQSKLLEKEAEKLVKNVDRWTEMYKKFNVALKEVGEVENWANAIEKDLKFVVDQLQELSSNS
jgi:DNA-binding helix-hairpin-helix protein with protein kinase domain